MERREHPRSKRRIPCELQHGGNRYRGIAVNVSPSGLFIQTDATLNPGAEVELELLVDEFRNFSLRGVVIHRRAIPPMLAPLIRPGVGVQIIEAPDAFFEVVEEKCVEPEDAAWAVEPQVEESEEIEIVVCYDADEEPSSEPPPAPFPEEAASAPEPSEEAAPDAPSPTAAKHDECDAPLPAEREAAADEPALLEPELADEGNAWPPETLLRSEALLIDDGELEDVYEMLEALGVAPVRDAGVGAEDFRDWEKPPRVVVVSARAASRLTVTTRGNAQGTVTIAVAEADSHTLCSMLRSQGFDYVVRRPVHPEALRLLLMRALYRGWERRSEPRLAFGCEITARWGMRRHPATLLEISSRFLGQNTLKPGTQVSVRIPRQDAGASKLTLRGRVRRSECRKGVASEVSAAVALTFDPLSRRTRKRLEALLAANVTGPSVLSRTAQQTSRAGRASNLGADVDRVPEATSRGSRRHPRARFDQEVVILDGSSERARQVLFASSC